MDECGVWAVGGGGPFGRNSYELERVERKWDTQRECVGRKCQSKSEDSWLDMCLGWEHAMDSI